MYLEFGIPEYKSSYEERFSRFPTSSEKTPFWQSVLFLIFSLPIIGTFYITNTLELTSIDLDDIGDYWLCKLLSMIFTIYLYVRLIQVAFFKRVNIAPLWIGKILERTIQRVVMVTGDSLKEGEEKKVCEINMFDISYDQWRNRIELIESQEAVSYDF